MKLKSRYAYNPTEAMRRYDLAGAIEMTVASGLERDGVAERAAAHAEACAEMLGRVVQMLHENGALTDANVLSLVSGFVRAES